MDVHPERSSRTLGPSKRLVVYAGPTGGHVFPAQSFAESFRKRFPDSGIHFVTCHRARPLVDKMPPGIFHTAAYFPEFGFSRVFSWRSLKLLWLVPYLFIQQFFFLKKFRPDLCVGFGSFVSYPGMMMAHWLGIPTLIHEQNKVPGKATHWLAPHMDAVAESFEETRFLKKPKALYTTGLPLRAFILEGISQKPAHPAPRPFTILVVGGSQGAQGLNKIVTGAITGLSDEEKAKIAVIHIAGKHDQNRVLESYERASVPNEVHVFYSAMAELFGRVDLAITRAGANTLFELAAFGLPALVIPYPHAGGHQRYNAESFAEKGGLAFHEEDPAAKDWLAGHLKNYIEDPGQLSGFAEKIKALAKPDAASKLVKIAQDLIESHEDHQR
ncbi:MAG TPA: UDP-N-acetylglucosamine--N-acetylmuramyl-(pentapeptide) pyrophosphoryl-undecaprenol N-acetylglucosamine transferase [Candidatus Omnitrophota bacterium]|nr:UDP-N-acetylglucosamine--N-acetylmuramyl-(pentapeptide) pyrophosphoryl-undecaprenol N-acetylglucosamine transferase [Candidatus Omnitrophota bacterium]